MRKIYQENYDDEDALQHVIWKTLLVSKNISDEWEIAEGIVSAIMNNFNFEVSMNNNLSAYYERE